MASIVNQEVHKKFKNAKRLLRDSNESEIEIEVREDEEQFIKLQEIVDILVAAGYFRARIKGLSAFDKVVGGMVWCIQSCNVDLDVDLLFRENLSIGQKIVLTEKIVAVLPKIKCPLSIEPHQIQGLDFIHIFPVIQWLVTKSLERREEIATFVRTCAVEQFNRKFYIKDKNESKHRKLLDSMRLVSEVYRPHRYYKKKNFTSNNNISQFQTTLLEYGYSDGTLVDYAMFTSKEKDIAEEEKFLDLNEENRESLKNHYTSLQSELKDAGMQSKEQLLRISLEEKKQLLNQKCKEFKLKESSLDEEIQNNNRVLQDLHKKHEQANEAFKDLSQGESENSKIKEIEDLIILNDELKVQESQFKEHCKKELANLKSLIQSVKEAKVNIPVGNVEDLTSELNQITERNRLLRIKLAKANREVAILQRKIDDVPKRAELAQYQKRFVELYNQVAVKHKETKQYYTLYNTLEDIRVYMEKELSLLNSISDSYPEAMSSNRGKEEFLDQLQNIVENVHQSKLKADQNLHKEKQKRDELNATLQSLIEQQRKYVTAVKQLGLEYKKHEMLIKTLG